MRYTEASFCKNRAMRNGLASQLQGMPLGTPEERDARRTAYEHMTPAQQAYEDACWEQSKARTTREVSAPLMHQR
ncbi:hypothetical protein ACI77J_11925 [Pseudomonas sp. O64]|uniref:hypothetical protein n=1 Tax=unclassified Pseudomonas TaxID=196821 RepID=UPI0021D7FC42|nr:MULTISPECIES: hypothetical protein [unclassified Pseudomonas]MCV2227568.1 hypothetical protein [Pseudomonas sp. AU10]UXZ19931.1 hypothetical protein KZH41_15325 [Pseudomonas sp. YeP6b]